MKISILTLLLAVILISCKKENTSIKTTDEISVNDSLSNAKTNSAEISKNSLQLDTFGFPPEVEGCSCYFAESKVDFDAEKYIYIDDYGNNGYIKVNGKLVKIPMEEGDFDPSNFQKNIENENFRIFMRGNKVKELEEVMMFEGEMTVENKKTDEKTTSRIYGECGC